MTYPSDKYAARLTQANGWHRELIFDRHGQPEAIVAVRVGHRWTDSVAIEGEDRCIAMRHRTHDDTEFVVPSELPGESTAVWRRDGRAEDVLAELLELPTE
ncbi:MAG: hypothetical protein GEU83_08535 [Pseudonocardiaceae bacterium]|nr:hypothetical protein [Pseudonocardiaceae bacterium]